jgi:hypothetical protein
VRRVRDAERMSESSVGALRDAGFEALDDYTGASDELGALWPPAHAVEQLRQDPLWPDGSVLWFVRSPWRSITLRELFDEILWPWVERDPSDRSEDLARERMSQVLSWTEDEAVARLSQLRRGLGPRPPRSP